MEQLLQTHYSLNNTYSKNDKPPSRETGGNNSGDKGPLDGARPFHPYFQHSSLALFVGHIVCMLLLLTVNSLLLLSVNNLLTH